MSGVRQVIVHYHFFKNGGSTLAGALKRNFGRDFAEIESGAANAPLDGGDLMRTILAAPNLRAVSSHTLHPPLPITEGIVVHEMYLLRNPLDRLRSIYDFYRYKGGQHPLVEPAKRLDLASFLKLLMTDYLHLAENSQLRTLVCKGSRIARKGDMEEAARILGRAACVGVVENYDASMTVAEHHLRTVFPKLDLTCLPRNVSAQRRQNLSERLDELRSVCGSTLYEELIRLNQLDSELVDMALAEVTRRSLEIPSFGTLLRDYRRRLGVRIVTQNLFRKFDKLSRYLRARIAQLTSSIFGLEAIDS
jgi:hypothetical protein